MNRVILMGYLTRDIDVRYTATNKAVANSAIAINKKFKNQMGELIEEVCFVDITFFGKKAEIANQYLGKGKRLLIEGNLKFNQWVDKMGNNRSKHSVIVENMEFIENKEQGPEIQKYVPKVDNKKPEIENMDDDDEILF